MKVLTLRGEELSGKGGIVIEWGLVQTRLWLILVKPAFVRIVGLYVFVYTDIVPDWGIQFVTCPLL